jgi:hypothetical protein
MCYVITIKTKSDPVVILETEFPRDKLDVGWLEIEYEFCELAAGKLKRSSIEQIVDLVRSLEKLDNVGQPARVLSNV